jgi:uncharacterized protein (DUF2141 family)
MEFGQIKAKSYVHQGQVICSLFTSATDFPKHTEKAEARANSRISKGHATCNFNGVRPGTYAVAVFHDENSNGKLDLKFTGVPREGVGASNNAKGHMGPPSFKDAAFQFQGGNLELAITIHYL